ncbi:hypothetical protein ACHRVK_10040 [Flavobacterium plurextorum]|uniref:hypothetical protein n=1 Tax=Flavobacterium plurextorum TaxID=1114867 RepID=UPI0037571160
MNNRTEKLLETYRNLSPKEAFEFNNMVTITYHSCKIEDSTLAKEEAFWLCLEALAEKKDKTENGTAL